MKEDTLIREDIALIFNHGVSPNAIDKIFELFKEWHNKLSTSQPVNSDVVEKAAEEYGSDNHKNNSMCRNASTKAFIAGAKWSSKGVVEGDAVAFAEWLASYVCPATKDYASDRLTLVDGDWYWSNDKHGDQPLNESELYNLYKSQK